MVPSYDHQHSVYLPKHSISLIPPNQPSTAVPLTSMKPGSSTT